MIGKDDSRAERLFAILGEIDPEMPPEATYKAKVSGKKIALAAISGLAAALVLTVGAVGLKNMHGIATTPTEPIVDISTPVLTEPPPSTEPPFSDTVVSEQPADTNETIPEDITDGIGGDEYAWFTLLVKQKFDGIDTGLSALFGGDMWLERKWADGLKDYGEATRLDETANIYSFIKAFDISREDAELFYEYCLDSGDDQLISRQELDIIYSGDEEAIAKTLASDYAIVVKDRIYTPYWLYTHSAEDYKAAGISPEDIKQMASLYDGAFCYLSEVDFEIGKAFYQKLRAYVPDIRFELLERSIALREEISLSVDGVVYDVAWLSSHTIQDYQSAGISIDDIKEVLSLMSPYGYSDEYEWINAAYERMISDMAGENTAEDSIDWDIADDTDPPVDDDIAWEVNDY